MHDPSPGAPAAPPRRLRAALPPLTAAMLALAVVQAAAQPAAPGPREVPAKTLPVPTTVSPQMRKLIAAPLTPTWNVIPDTAEGWKEQVKAGADAAMKGLPALREALKVKVEPVVVDGVKAHLVTPAEIARRTATGCSFMCTAAAS